MRKYSKKHIKKLGKRVLSFALAMIMGASVFVGGSSLPFEEAYAATPNDAEHPSYNETVFGDGGVTHNGKITKSAKWLDIENGIGEITITEEDTGYVKQGLPGYDYVFVLDSSHSMDFIMSGISSFCINPYHYYKLQGRNCKIYGYDMNSAYIAYLKDDMTTINKEDSYVEKFDNVDKANQFYALMFGYDIWENDEDYKTEFTGYIFSCNDNNGNETPEDLWHYDYYDEVRISTKIYETQVARNNNPDYWSASANPKKYAKAKELIENSEELQNAGLNPDNPPLIHTIRAVSRENYYANASNSGHYNQSGAPIGFQYHDMYGKALSQEESTNHINNNNMGYLRWGYTDASCVNKLTATKNTMINIVNEVSSKDPTAKIAFIPFGYSGYQSSGVTPITDVASIGFTSVANKDEIINAINNCVSQGSTTYAEWIDKLDEFMQVHNKDRADRPVKVIFMSDGFPTDSRIEDSVMNSRLGQLAQQLVDAGYYAERDEALKEVISFTILGMRASKPFIWNGINYGNKKYNFTMAVVGAGYGGQSMINSEESSNSANESTASLLQAVGRYGGAEKIYVRDKNGNILKDENNNELYDYFFVAPNTKDGKAYFDTTKITEKLNAATNSSPITVTNKTLTDMVSDKYEIISVSSEDGVASFNGQSVTWDIYDNYNYSIPETNTLKIKIKLKDEYRFLISDTYYATNADTTDVHGCQMTYSIDGVNKSTSVATPWLKYGTIEEKGQKIWTVEGSQLDAVEILLQRKLEGETFQTVETTIVDNSNDYSYDFVDRTADDIRYPLIKYNNVGDMYTYRISENMENYKEVDHTEVEDNNVFTYDIYNEPHKADIILTKTDPVHNDELVYNAEFTVYEYAGVGDITNPHNYKEYKGKHIEGYWGTMFGEDTVKLLESDDEKGIYRNTEPLYYSTMNQGHFMIKETTTPHGYYGDYLDDLTVSANDAGKPEFYKPHFITMNSIDHEQLFNIENNGTTFDDIPINTIINVQKIGETPVVTFDEEGNVADITYEKVPLPDAWYVVRATTDIYYPFKGETVLAYAKGDFVELNNFHYHSLSEQFYSEELGKVVADQTDEVTATYLDVSEQKVKNLVATVTDEMGKSDFTITWEHADLPVNAYIVSPLGTIYSTANYAEFIVKTDNSITFELNEVIAGDWNIVLEGTKLGEINVSISESEEITEDDGIVTKHITNDEIDEDKLYVDSYVFNEENPDENKIVFTNGESVSAIYATDDEGLIQLSGLPLGTYEVIEVKAPAGYTRESGNSSQFAHIVCDNDYTKEVVVDLTFENNRQVLSLDGNETPDTEIIVDDPAISVSKQSDKYVYWGGETVHYYITVTNTGHTDLRDVTVEDYFEDELPIILGTIDYLKVGESKDFTYDYFVPEDTKDKTKLNNIVIATGTEVIKTDDSVSENEIDDLIPRVVQDRDDCEVIVTDNGIVVTKEADKKVYQPGEFVFYTIRVTNANDTPLYNVIVDDNYIGEVLNEISFISADIEGVQDNHGYVTINELPANGTVTLNYYVEVPETTVSGEYENIVVVNGEGSDYRIPNISITKTTDKYLYKPGETAIYTITVTNNGEVNLKAVEVVDSLEGEFVEDANEIGDLKVGESKTLTYKFVIPEDLENFEDAVPVKTDENIFSQIDETKQYYKIKNIAGVSGKGTHTNEEGKTVTTTVTDEDDEDILVVQGEEGTPSIAKIEVIKELTSRYVTKPNKTATYEITVKNTGTVNLTDVTLKDSLEELGGTWVEEMSPFDLRVGESKTFEYTYVIPSDAKDKEVIHNIVEAEGKGVITYLDKDGNEQEKEVPVSDSDDADTIVKLNHDVTDEDDEIVLVMDPEIRVVKVADKENYKVGETVDFTITVKNTGNCDLQNVVLTDYLDGEFIETLTESERDIVMSTDKVYIDYLSVDEEISFSYHYIAKETDADVDNVVRVTATTIPDDDDPTIPIIPVKDEDDEIIHVGHNVGVRKLGRSESEIHAVEGAYIGLYAKEDIYAMKDVHNPDAEPIIKADTLVDSAYTNEFGYAQFEKDLPLGKYYAKELETAAGYFATDSIIWFDSSDLIYNDQVDVVYRGGDILDAQTLVYIYLKDDTTFNELADAGLQITDADGNVVEAFVTKNTNGEGHIIKGLSVDTEYTLSEAYARTGYVKDFIRCLSNGGGEILESDEKSVKFIIHPAVTTMDEDGKIIEETIPEPLRITVTNDFVKGNVKVNKLGEVLESWTLVNKIYEFVKSLFGYILGNLEGVEFKVVAKTDIIHPDGVTGTLLKAGDLAFQNVDSYAIPAIGTTDRMGIVQFTHMYLGNYSLVETKGLDGYALLAEPIDFCLKFVNDTTPIVEATAGSVLEVINDRQKVYVTINKMEKDTDIKLAGAVFGLYNEEDITNYNGDVIVKRDTLLETGITGNDGKLLLESDVPLGKYYIKEISAPKGYELNEGKFSFDVTKVDNDMEAIYIEFTVFNEKGITPQTGDVSDLGTYAVGLLLAGVGVIALVRRKRITV